MPPSSPPRRTRRRRPIRAESGHASGQRTGLRGGRAQAGRDHVDVEPVRVRRNTPRRQRDPPTGAATRAPEPAARDRRRSPPRPAPACRAASRSTRARHTPSRPITAATSGAAGSGGMPSKPPRGSGAVPASCLTQAGRGLGATTAEVRARRSTPAQRAGRWRTTRPRGRAAAHRRCASGRTRRVAPRPPGSAPAARNGRSPGPGSVRRCRRPPPRPRTGRRRCRVEPVVRVRHGWSWTNATSRVRTSGSVSGGTPWPRFTTCPGALSPARSTSAVCRFRAPARRTAEPGSMLPCNGFRPAEPAVRLVERHPVVDADRRPRPRPAVRPAVRRYPPRSAPAAPRGRRPRPTPPPSAAGRRRR